jgi:hypothetical protein
LDGFVQIICVHLRHLRSAFRAAAFKKSRCVTSPGGFPEAQNYRSKPGFTLGLWFGSGCATMAHQAQPDLLPNNPLLTEQTAS